MKPSSIQFYLTILTWRRWLVFSMPQKKLQLKNAEDTAGEVHHTLEIQNLGQALKELRIQIAEKNSQLESYEKVDTLRPS